MDFGRRQDPRQRAIGIGFVVLFHVALVYALILGLEHKSITLLPPPIETKVIKQSKQQEKPPPPPPPQFQTPPPPTIPPPAINVQSEAPRATAITEKTGPTHPPPPRPVRRTAPVIDAQRNCQTPRYPPVAQRLGETGTVLLRMLVGTDGNVVKSEVERSSGYRILDEAAQRALSRCHFKPGTVDGKPTEAWARLKYTFRETD